MTNPSVPGEPSRDMPEWIAAKEMLYLPKGARPAGDWFKMEKGEACDGNQYTIYIRADLVSARIATLEADLKAERDACVIIDIENESLRARLSRDSARRKELADELSSFDILENSDLEFDDCIDRVVAYLRETP